MGKQSFLAKLKRERKKRDAESARVYAALWADPKYVRLTEQLQKVIHRSVELDAYPKIYSEKERELARAAEKRAARNLQEYEDDAFERMTGKRGIR